MSPLLLDFMQLIQTTTGELALTGFTTHYLSSCVADPSHVGNHYFHYRSPILGAKLLHGETYNSFNLLQYENA